MCCECFAARFGDGEDLRQTKGIEELCVLLKSFAVLCF